MKETEFKNFLRVATPAILFTEMTLNCLGWSMGRNEVVIKEIASRSSHTSEAALFDFFRKSKLSWVRR